MAQRDSSDPNFDDLREQIMNFRSPFGDTLYNAMAQRGNAPGGVGVTSEPGPNQDDLYIVDRIMPPQTIPHFLEFASYGRLPGGKQTEEKLIATETFDLVQQPYSDWALPPYNSLPDHVIHAAFSRIGSTEDASRLQIVDKRIHSAKSRLWEGITPLSARRWQEKQLDAPENFKAASQHLSLVIDAFKYLNTDVIRGALKDTYNLIYDHFDEFDKAHAAYLESRGENTDVAKLTALWADFVRAHYAHMAAVSHRWVYDQIVRLRADVYTQVEAHAPEDLSTYDAKQWEWTNKIHDLTETLAHADEHIVLFTHGYKGIPESAEIPSTPIEAIDGSQPAAMYADNQQRAKSYSTRLRYLSRKATFEAVTRSLGRPPRQLGDPREIMESLDQQREAQDTTRLELRGEPPKPAVVQWVSDLLRSPDQLEWGYVGYRLSYKHTDEEWEEFKRKFEADVASWGDNELGAEELKTKAKVLWLDGKDVGLEEGDYDAAKVIFQSYTESEDFPENVIKDTVLIADHWVISSYLKPASEISPPGDHGGHVLLLDALWDDDIPDDHAEEHPGYEGRLRVLSSVLWDDVTALSVAQAQHLEDLWPMAMIHPHQVYTGPVVEEQRLAWQEMMDMKSSMMAGFEKFLREKKGFQGDLGEMMKKAGP